ncbi:hypothetical protein ABTU82_08000, partial [Microbacterium sp. A1-JK]
TTGFSGNGEISVSFSLPAVEGVFSVTSPKPGETVDSRTITFTGTGENGSFVNVLDENGDRIPGTGSAVVSNGVWSTTGTYADDASVAQTITAFQTTGFSGNGEISVSFSLPASVVPNPEPTSTASPEPTSTASPTATPIPGLPAANAGASDSLAATGYDSTGIAGLAIGGAMLAGAGAVFMAIRARARRVS